MHDFLIFSEPKVPTGFNYTRVYRKATVLMLTFEWDPPQDFGLDLTVDSYVITILPHPKYYHTTQLLYPPNPWNVTLYYNTKYTMNITAVNCVGESDPFVIGDINFGKDFKHMALIEVLRVRGLQLGHK